MCSCNKPETGETEYKRVVQTFVNETDELVDVTIDGKTIRSTPSHPFYSAQKGWTSAINLRAGDILVLNNGEYVVVEQIQHELLESPGSKSITLKSRIFTPIMFRQTRTRMSLCWCIIAVVE